jgi:hypothetical protein
MPKRIVSFLLALCYLSVSLSVFNLHFHDHADPLQHSCAVCAWHSESVTDEPVDPAFTIVPVIVVAHFGELELKICASVPNTSSDRGPPLYS